MSYVILYPGSKVSQKYHWNLTHSESLSFSFFKISQCLTKMALPIRDYTETGPLKDSFFCFYMLILATQWVLIYVL